MGTLSRVTAAHVWELTTTAFDSLRANAAVATVVQRQMEQALQSDTRESIVRMIHTYSAGCKTMVGVAWLTLRHFALQQAQQEQLAKTESQIAQSAHLHEMSLATVT